MTLSSVIILISVIVILICMIRLLSLRPRLIAKIENYSLPETNPKDDREYWKVQHQLFTTRCLINHLQFRCVALSHGLFISYEGVSLNENTILFCIYNRKDLDALMMAIQRMERLNEPIRQHIMILYGDTASVALSADCVNYLSERHQKADVILSLSKMFSYVLDHQCYAFLGVQRKQTLRLKIEGMPDAPENTILPSSFTYQTLQTLHKAFDHRIDLQYLLHRTSALRSLKENKQLSVFCTNTLYKLCGEIMITSVDEEGQEELVSLCQKAAAQANKKLYLLEREAGGKDSQSCFLAGKIHRIYRPYHHVKVVDGYFVADEEAKLDEIAPYHIAFIPPTVNQISLRDFFVFVLGK